MAWLSNKELTTEQKRIRDDLMEQLEAKRCTTSYYRDLVNDYISMMRIRDDLQKKIDNLGTLIEYNYNGMPNYKKNDAVDQFNKITDRMVKHLDFLGLKPVDTIKEEDDDDEL